MDLDRGLLLRHHGSGSSTGPYDDCWIQLLSVAQVDEGGVRETGVIQAARRHKYDADPGLSWVTLLLRDGQSASDLG